MFLFLKDRIHKVEDLVTSNFEFLWLQPKDIDLKDLNIDPKHALQSCLECVRNMEQFEESEISKQMKNTAKESGIKFQFYMAFLRICLTGFKVIFSPSYREFFAIFCKFVKR